MNTKLKWKYPVLFLLKVGISNVGDWIYFLALNLVVLNMTGSALAVVGLYLVKPMAVLLTNSWAGSFIDRLNKRMLMIWLDLLRGIVIGFLPFFIGSLSLIYVMVLFINMMASIFEPASMSYMTRLIAPNMRKRFNSVHSFVSSGAFLVGPAVTGVLLLTASPTFAIYLNAIALIIASIITWLLPNVEKDDVIVKKDRIITRAILKSDWQTVIMYSLNNRYVITIYFLFTTVMIVLASAVDSLEASFAKQVLLLSDSEYGFLVTIAGAGIIIGAAINTLVAHKLNISIMVGVGTFFVTVGYIVYAFSASFFYAGLGFFILAFFIACANTGFLTFYQNHVPTNMMGRIGSIYNLLEAILIIVVTTLLGGATLFLSIRFTVILGVCCMLIVSAVLLAATILPSKRDFFTMHITD
ncbi:MFS transporter [Oceanobacillus kapialis]|uniref:MFS transporter n=1 Tax=Oceanobacillus kapialis TaxID=481353 RepID=UPI00384EA5F1